MDITVPTEDSSRAAFACSVTPDEYLPSIEWYFEAGSGSGMGPEMDPKIVDVTNENITVEDGAPDPGTSILVLSGDAAQQEGVYICTVTFQDGTMLTSNASLTTNSKCVIVKLIVNSSFYPLPFLSFLQAPLVVTLPSSSRHPRDSDCTSRGGTTSSLCQLFREQYHF